VNLSQAMGWQKTLQTRHNELVQLRNENSSRSTRLWGEKQEKITEPVYDVKHLDNLVTKIAIEIRKLDEGIKTTNAVTQVLDYVKNEDVLGEVR